jgi:hypothetical protein
MTENTMIWVRNKIESFGSVNDFILGFISHLLANAVRIN